MATKTLSGYLRDPLGEFSEKDKVKFQALTTEGTVIAGSISVFDIDSTGYYEVTVQYGEFEISTRNRYTSKWTSHGVYTVDASTTATSLPVLIGASTPSSDADLIEVQELIQQAATAAENAQQSAEDAEGYDSYITGSFESETCQVTGDVATPEPALHIPFNDGLRIESGYGTNDQIDVSAAQDGSVMVDLPSKSVDFTRSSTSTVINKSGNLVELAADEAGIGSDGVWFHDSYSNLIRNSEDLTEDGWYRNSGASVSGTDGIILQNSTSYLRQEVSSLSTYDIGDEAFLSFFVKKGVGDYLKLTCYYALGSAGGTYSVIDVENKAIILQNTAMDITLLTSHIDNVEWLYVKVKLTYNSSSYTSLIINFSNSDSSGGGLGSSETEPAFYITKVSFTEKNYYLPYIPTGSSTSTATATTCTIPVENNMPAAGESFTIACDFIKPTTVSFLLETVTRGFGLFFNSSGSLYCRGVSSQVLISTDLTAGSKYRCTFVIDGTSITSYANGELLSEVALPTIDLDRDYLYIGGNGASQNLNSQLKNFKIYHSALTAEQVAALGAAE